MPGVQIIVLDAPAKTTSPALQRTTYLSRREAIPVRSFVFIQCLILFFKGRHGTELESFYVASVSILFSPRLIPPDE